MTNEQQPAEQPLIVGPCQTCNGRGWIGGPSYREPDEGGVQCPDCNAIDQQTKPADHGRGVGEVVRRVIHELRTYNPPADPYNGAHIHGVWANELEAALSLPRQSEAVPVGEIVLFGGMKEVSWKAGKLPDIGTKLYTTPPAAQGQAINVRMLNMLKQVRERGFTQATLDNLDRVIAAAEQDPTPAAHGVAEP